MTTQVRPTHDEAMATAAEWQHLQMWRAAQTVRAHVSAEHGRDDLLDCLGLSEVTAPAAHVVDLVGTAAHA